MSFKIVIPARYASTRLPCKVLLPIAGKPMLQHVYERAITCGADSVLIATDDVRIVNTAQAFGASVCMTAIDHVNGTSRIAEAMMIMGYTNQDIIVNVQADEPFIPPSLIQQVAKDLQTCKEADAATLYESLTTPADLYNPHKVKVVFDNNNYALYFSRAPIPWDRDHFDLNPPAHLLGFYYRHIGIYAFRGSLLKKYTTLTPSPLEEIEKLEQLRLLWHGFKIHLTATQTPVLGDINTLADLQNL